mgnify:CR=1 FL=1
MIAVKCSGSKSGVDMVNFSWNSSYQLRRSLVKSFNRIALHIVIHMLLFAVEKTLELLNVECKEGGKLVLNFSMPVKVSRKHCNRCLLYAIACYI